MFSLSNELCVSISTDCSLIKVIPYYYLNPNLILNLCVDIYLFYSPNNMSLQSPTNVYHPILLYVFHSTRIFHHYLPLFLHHFFHTFFCLYQPYIVLSTEVSGFYISSFISLYSLRSHYLRVQQLVLLIITNSFNFLASLRYQVHKKNCKTFLFKYALFSNYCMLKFGPISYRVTRLSNFAALRAFFSSQQ